MKDTKGLLAFLLIIFFANDCLGIDMTFAWSNPNDINVRYHEICYGETMNEINNQTHCINVGFDTSIVDGVSNAVATLRGLSDTKSYFFATRACSLLECADLCQPIFIDASPSTTYAVIGDFDGDGVVGILDFSVWYIKFVEGKMTIWDYSVWYSGFVDIN